MELQLCRGVTRTDSSAQLRPQKLCSSHGGRVLQCAQGVLQQPGALQQGQDERLLLILILWPSKEAHVQAALQAHQTQMSCRKNDH